MSKDVALWGCSLWGPQEGAVLGEEQDALSGVESVSALWRLAVPAGCPSLALLPRGHTKSTI